MIRVGFLVQYDAQGWTGGINYLSNLFHAVRAQPESRLEPVLFTGVGLNPDLERRFPGFRIVRSRWLDGGGPRGVLRRASMRLLGRSIGITDLLRRERVTVLSHSGDPGRGLGIPAIGWIADFQHLHVTELFSAKERADRDSVIRRLIEHCELVVVSSQHAAGDLASFAPTQTSKARVLRFVATPQDPARLPDLVLLRQQYGFAEPYFHLPNQFWAHKNHRIVIDALATIARSGHAPLVLATGSTTDYRNPGHYERLMQHAREAGIGDRFRSLGLVPFEHLGGLMRHCVAVINPSLFEGWSTTVEESKSIGKTVILSDIAVHREQAPERARYFSPTDANGLANHMLEAVAAFDESAERRHELEARERWPERLAAFGAEYCRIVAEVVNQPAGV